MLSFPKIYYVYQYFDPIRQEYFYVGKGKDKRDLNRKNKLVNNRIGWIKKQGQSHVISRYAQNLEEPNALTIESFLIKEIGRDDLGEGPLLNLTDGGEGTSGRRHSKETKEKLSKTQQENPSLGMLGKKHSQETKLKMSVWRMGIHVSQETRHKQSLQKIGKKRKTFTKSTKNKMAEVQSSVWMVTFPDGHKEKIFNLRNFSKVKDINPSNLYNRGYSKGFKATKYQETI